MPEPTTQQKKLVSARKTARAIFGVFIAGGALLLLWGIYTTYWPTISYGALLLAGSTVPFVASKNLEKKIQASLV